MNDDTLTTEERSLLERLRDIPEDELRDDLLTLFCELADHARDPRCARAQGDGVPCDTTSLDCEECRLVVTAAAVGAGR
jgi:hypothetical protein